METQQNSDITYRVYDYGRLSNGKPRELHIDKSIDVITVPAKSAADSVKSVADLPVNTLNELYACKYFHIYKIDVSGKMTFEQNAPFMNMTVTDGNGIVNGQPVKKGDNAKFPKLTNRVHYLKHEEGGVNAVCEIMRKYSEEVAEKAYQQGEEAGKEIGQRHTAIAELQSESR